MRNGTTLNDFMHWDNTLFDGIALPSDINHDVLVGQIMLRCGLQNPLYEDYDVFKSQTHLWFVAHEWNFTRLVKLIKEEYNPLWNKDGYETREIDHTRDEVESISRDIATSDDTTRNATTNTTSDETAQQSGTTTAQENKSDTYTDTHQVMGFNATAWQDTDHTQHDGSENGTSTTTHGLRLDTDASGSETLAETVGEDIKTDDDTARTLNRGKTVETIRTYGNIGVTMSQDMFMKEVELLDGFNLYDFIAKKFDDDLMLGVYTY